MTQRSLLAAFVEAMETQTAAGQRDMIKAHIDAGHDGYTAGSDTDGFSVVMLGVQAIGIGEADTIRQWRRAARTLLGGYAAIDHDPNRREAQLDWSAFVLGHHRGLSNVLLRNACDVALALSQSPFLRTAATETLRVLNLCAQPETT